MNHGDLVKLKTNSTWRRDVRFYKNLVNRIPTPAERAAHEAAGTRAVEVLMKLDPEGIWVVQLAQVVPPYHVSCGRRWAWSLLLDLKSGHEFYIPSSQLSPLEDS